MSVESNSQVDQPVVEIRQISFENNVGVYQVTFANGVTLEETYQVNELTEDGKEPMSGSDFISLLNVENDPTLKYKIVRTMGTCTQSTIVTPDESQPQEEVKIEGDQGTDIAFEGFWSELGKVAVRSLSVGMIAELAKKDEFYHALDATRRHIIEGGADGVRDLIVPITRLSTPTAHAIYTIMCSYGAVMGRIESVAQDGSMESRALLVATEGFFPGNNKLNAHLVDMVKEYEKAKDDKKVGVLKAIDAYRKDLGKKDPAALYAIGCVYMKSGEEEFQTKALKYINVATAGKEDQEKFNELLRKAKLGKYVFSGTVGKEEMMFGTDIPEMPNESVDDDDPIYARSRELVEKVKTAKYSNEEDFEKDGESLADTIENAKEKPCPCDLIAGGYAMLFVKGGLESAVMYLGEASKDGNEAETALADRVLKAIEDKSIVEDVPMLSYMFDDYDKDLHKDMIKSYELVEDGKSEEDKGDIKFGMGKEAQRKLEEGEDLVPYDYYCIAVILEHSDLDEDSNRAIEEGKKKSKELERDLDVLQFELLESQIS